jgi:hypothetical protein
MLTPSAGLSWGNHAAHSFKRRTDQFDPWSPSHLPEHVARQSNSEQFRIGPEMCSKVCSAMSPDVH